MSSRESIFLVLTIATWIFGFLTVVTPSPYVVTYEETGENGLLPSKEEQPLLGTKRCTRGPAYWCHNITQAKECGAVQHCIQKVWEPMKPTGDNDSVCDICKEMVKEARDQLLSNETQDELRQVLEGSCKLIPLKVVSSKCCELADEFIPELVDALTSRMDPEVVCTVSGLCNSVQIDGMLEEMKEIDATDEFDLMEDSCPKCSHYIGKVIASIKKLSKRQLLHHVFEICGHLGSYSDSCRAMAMEEIDELYATVQAELNAPEVCGLFGLCEVVSFHPVKIHSSSSSVRVWSPPAGHDFQCDFCKQLIAYFKNWFTSDTTKEEFQEIITGLCKQTGKYKTECLNLAKEYGDLLYNLISEELDPEQACIFMMSCNATDTIRGRIKLFSSASNRGPIWTILQSDESMKRIESAERLAGDDEQPSHQPGFTYPMITLTPAEKMTGNDERSSSVAKKGVENMLPTCHICTFVVGKVFDMIGRNQTKEAIDWALEGVCNAVPERYENECLNFMREYGETVTEIIVVEGTANGVCMALHLCLMSPSNPIPPTSSDVKLVEEALVPFDRIQTMIIDEISKMNVDHHGNPACPLCEFVMTQLAQVLKDNATEQEMKDTVEHVCTYLPKTLEMECQDFVDEYGDTIVQYLVQEFDPKTICTELKLCGNDVFVSDNGDVVVMDEVMNMDKCHLCMLVSNYLSAFLDDPNVDTSIDELVERVCPLLPKKHQMECKELIEDYGPYLLSLMAQSVDKGKACATVDLCPS